MISVYQMCVNNCAVAIKRSQKSLAAGEICEDEVTSAFDLARGVAVGFCKDVREVTLDIANAANHVKDI